jgi:pyochelin biosynthesis protein PchC
LTNLWLRSFSSSPETPKAVVQLICFPHAGGSASYFRTLSSLLSPVIEVLAVQYPGRQDRYREPMPADLRTLAASIAAGLGQPTAPARAFLGHSMGAVVAYEAARALGPGSRPMALVASGRRAPSSSRIETVHTLDDESLVNEVLSLGGTEVEAFLDPDVRQMVLPVIRNDYRLIETYRHVAGPRLELPITVLVGEHDRMTMGEEAQAWQQHTAGPFALHRLAGGHFILSEQPQAVADVLLRNLIPIASHGDRRS